LEPSFRFRGITPDAGGYGSDVCRTVLMTTSFHYVTTADVDLHPIGPHRVPQLRHSHIDIVNRAIKRAHVHC